MSSAFEGMWQPWGQVWAPLAGLSETDDAYVAEVELLGVKKDDAPDIAAFTVLQAAPAPPVPADLDEIISWMLWARFAARGAAGDGTGQDSTGLLGISVAAGEAGGSAMRQRRDGRIRR